MPCVEQLRPRSAAAEHQRGLALAKSGDFDKYCYLSLPTFPRSSLKISLPLSKAFDLQID
jgi:hypothetical protein